MKLEFGLSPRQYCQKARPKICRLWSKEVGAPSQLEICPSTSLTSNRVLRSVVRSYSVPVSASLDEGVLSVVSGGWGLYRWWPTRLVPNQYHLLPNNPLKRCYLWSEEVGAPSQSEICPSTSLISNDTLTPQIHLQLLLSQGQRSMWCGTNQ